MSCVAYECNNRTPGKRAKKVPGLSFHRFPKNDDLRAKWVKAVNRQNWEPSKFSCLCSEHFKESDFDRTPFVTRLKLNVVPSIFKAFPVYLQPKTPSYEQLQVSVDPDICSLVQNNVQNHLSRTTSIKTDILSDNDTQEMNGSEFSDTSNDRCSSPSGQLEIVIKEEVPDDS